MKNQIAGTIHWNEATQDLLLVDNALASCLQWSNKEFFMFIIKSRDTVVILLLLTSFCPCFDMDVRQKIVYIQMLLAWNGCKDKDCTYSNAFGLECFIPTCDLSVIMVHLGSSCGGKKHLSFKRGNKYLIYR